MKAIIKMVLATGLLLSCGLTYAGSLEGNIGKYAIFSLDLDGGGAKNYIMVDVLDPNVTECAVGYVGYGVVFMSLEVTGSELLKNQAAYSSIIAAQAAGFSVKTDYHLEHSSVYNADFCYMDSFIVFTPQ